MSRRHMRIKDMTIQSEMFDVIIGGVLFPGRSLSSSRLRLTSDFRNTHASAAIRKKEAIPKGRKDGHLLNGLVSFKIGGTVEHPTVQMTLPVD